MGRARTVARRAQPVGGPTHVARREHSLARAPERDRFVRDPEAGAVPGLTRGRNLRSERRCSMCSAIHTNSRSSLRPSSTRGPSDPPPRDVFVFRLRKSARALPTDQGRCVYKD